MTDGTVKLFLDLEIVCVSLAAPKEQAHVLLPFQHIEAFEWGWYNPDHVRNYLLRENIDPKPKDFLSKFLQKVD